MNVALLGLLLRAAGLALRHPAADPAGADAGGLRAAAEDAADAEDPKGYLEPVVVECDGRKVSFPASMLLIDGKALWCPNAKVATTSLYKVLLARIGLNDVSDGSRCTMKGCVKRWADRGIESVKQVPAARHRQLCDAYSFTFVRNPWDRVRSAFQDKVVEGATPDRIGGYYGPRVGGPGAKQFETFIRFVGSNPNADIHFMPFESRCRTNSFEYSFIGRLEDDFDAHVHEVFAASGLDIAASAWANPAAQVLARVDARSTVPGLNSSAAAQVLARVDARQPVAVPHAQDSGYESRLRERRAAYLQDGLEKPRELVNRVAEIYAMDIAPFGYSFTD